MWNDITNKNETSYYNKVINLLNKESPKEHFGQNCMFKSKSLYIGALEMAWKQKAVFGSSE